MRAVGEGEPLAPRAGEAPRERRAVPAGLLVGELAGEEDGRPDLVDEGDRRERIGHRGVVEAVGVDLLEQVDGLGVQDLVVLARLVAALDALERPALAAGGRRRLGVADSVPGPREGEAGVQEPARVERRCRVVDDRQRRDGGQAGRRRRPDEQLADAAVGDPHHAHVTVRDPWLAGDGFDDVVAVEALQRLEVVERPARAPGAPHVDVDDGVAQQQRELRDRALAAVGVGVAVARVLDERRVRALTRRQLDVDRKLRSVAGLQVAVAGAGDRLLVERRARRRGALGQHVDRGRERSPGAPGTRGPSARRGRRRRRGSRRAETRPRRRHGRRAPAAIPEPPPARAPAPRCRAR